MAPRVTEAHLEARRRQILDAATTCFARQGFHQTTMHAIAAEADLSAGALYRYYPGKADIIKAMAEEDRDRSAQVFAAAVPLTDTAGLLRELAAAFFGRFDDLRSAANTSAVDIDLWAESIRNDDVRVVMRESVDTGLAQMTAVVQTAQARGDIDAELSAQSIAHVLVSAYMGLEVQRVLFPEIDVRSYVEALLAMVVGRFWHGREVGAEEIRADARAEAASGWPQGGLAEVR